MEMYLLVWVAPNTGGGSVLKHGPDIALHALSLIFHEPIIKFPLRILSILFPLLHILLMGDVPVPSQVCFEWSCPESW